MADKGLFLQNVIALVWDFDRTLSPQYMQDPLFEAYDIDAGTFWREVNSLPAYYARAGITVQPDTCYLGHLLSYVAAGRMRNLTNAKLRELGAHIKLYPGLPALFDELKQLVRGEEFIHADLRVEHYVVSTGLKEMVKGSPVAPYLDGVWASEFIEVPAGPGMEPAGRPASGSISQIAGLLDNTTKTRALFEINKGVNREPSVSVNSNMPEEERRVPFRNMIYIADGPSDIPSFSVVKRHGGKTLAVFDPSDGLYERGFRQAKQLHDTGRVHFFGEANYTTRSMTYAWLHNTVVEIAREMVHRRRSRTTSSISEEPGHIR